MARKELADLLLVLKPLRLRPLAVNLLLPLLLEAQYHLSANDRMEKSCFTTYNKIRRRPNQPLLLAQLLLQWIAKCTILLYPLLSEMSLPFELSSPPLDALRQSI